MKSFIADKNRKLTKLALLNIEDLSYSALLKALRKKDVKVNGKRVGEDVMLCIGDIVEVYYQSANVKKYQEVFLDNNVLVVYKKSGYLSEALYEDIKSEYPSAKFIHRLDRNTDGVMIFALNEKAETELLQGFKNHTFDKKYHALVVGVPKKKEAVLSAYLVKDEESSTVKIYAEKTNGAVAIKTGYKVIEERGDCALLEVELFTGKTHQIRAHLAYVGNPIVGDGKYGDFNYNKNSKFKNQQLTAVELTLHFNKGDSLFYLDKKTFSTYEFSRRK